MKTLQHITYDGSFNGFLSVVFTIFQQEECPLGIKSKKREDQVLFPSEQNIETDLGKARRVWRSLEKKSSNTVKGIYFAFLSEQNDIELLLFRYIKSLFRRTAEDPVFDPREKSKIFQLAQNVAKEKQRIETFTQLSDGKTGFLKGDIQPKYNVLPLISKHFKSQYGNHPWMITDTKRDLILSFDGLYLGLQPYHKVQSDGLEQLKQSFTSLHGGQKIAV
ncbi:MAG: TIGR03915 family putative DNA repair protein [Bacteroidia bacterium]|nr:TIGR03915 family putative DNA repair protein [Bacteroidia bacterium]